MQLDRSRFLAVSYIFHNPNFEFIFFIGNDLKLFYITLFRICIDF